MRSALSTVCFLLGFVLAAAVGLSHAGTVGENLSPDGDFADGAGWSLNSGATIEGGSLNANVAANVSFAIKTLSTTELSAGSWYQVAFTVLPGSTGHVRIGACGNLSSSENGPGSYTTWVKCNTSTAQLAVRSGTAPFAGSVDNLDVRLFTAGPQVPPAEPFVPEELAGLELPDYKMLMGAAGAFSALSMLIFWSRGLA